MPPERLLALITNEIVMEADSGNLVVGVNQCIQGTAGVMNLELVKREVFNPEDLLQSDDYLANLVGSDRMDERHWLVLFDMN